LRLPALCCCFDEDGVHVNTAFVRLQKRLCALLSRLGGSCCLHLRQQQVD
jgi:hypothetical protein